MAQFIAKNPDAQVNGETILSVVQGMAHFKERALRILEEKGISNPQPGYWYAQQSWLDAFAEIADSIGEQTLFQIGKQIPHNAQWPPHVDNMVKALASIDIAFHMNHSINSSPLFDPQTGTIYEGIGNYHFEQVGEKQVKITCDNSYPCEFDKGILKGVVEKFKTEDILDVEFKHGKNSCRKDGGTECVYLVKWQ